MRYLKKYKIFENDNFILTEIDDMLLSLRDDGIITKVEWFRDIHIKIDISEFTDEFNLTNHRDEIEMVKSYLEDSGYSYKGAINVYRHKLEWEDIFDEDIDSISLVFAEK